MLLTEKYSENLVLAFYNDENLHLFFFIRFSFSFQIFFIANRFFIKYLLNNIADFIPILTIFFQQFCIFYQKRYIFSFIKSFSRCSHFWKHYKQGHYFFILFFITNKIFKYLKPFLPKENLLDTTASSFCVACCNRAFALVKFMLLNFSITQSRKFSSYLYIYMITNYNL